mgnify:CR=1 FL=1
MIGFFRVLRLSRPASALDSSSTTPGSRGFSQSLLCPHRATDHELLAKRTILRHIMRETRKRANSTAIPERRPSKRHTHSLSPEHVVTWTRAPVKTRRQVKVSVAAARATAASVTIDAIRAKALSRNGRRSRVSPKTRGGASRCRGIRCLTVARDCCRCR